MCPLMPHKFSGPDKSGNLAVEGSDWVSSSRKASWISGHLESASDQAVSCSQISPILPDHQLYTRCPFLSVLRTIGRLPSSPSPVASINSVIPSLLQGWLPSGAHYLPTPTPRRSQISTEVLTFLGTLLLIPWGKLNRSANHNR